METQIKNLILGVSLLGAFGCLPQGSQPLVEVSPEQEEVKSSPAQSSVTESQSTPTPAAPLVWQVVPLFTNAFTPFSPQNEQTEYRCYYKNSETYFSMTFYGHESGGYGHAGWIRLPGQDRRSMNWNNKLSSLRIWISRATSEQPFAGLAAAEIKDITYQPVVNGSRGDILSGGRIEFEANQNTDFYTFPLEFEDCVIRPFTY